MKIFYLSHELFYCILYSDSKENAFKKMKLERGKLLNTLGVSLDITEWVIEEFTPDLYDGILCFY